MSLVRLSSSPQLRILSILLLIGTQSCSQVNSNEDDWELALDENEKVALEAIKCLHRQLDDDKDGNINLHESNEYLREELKYERDFEKRQKVFHRNNDNQVTVKELWETWVKSEVHNWTVDQTIEWLGVFVGLPQYKPVFIRYSLNGTFLPRLAVNHLQFLSSGLGVKDMIHRQKISLKAQDVVLFGPPKEHSNYVKDVILTTLLAIAVGFCWSVYSRYKSSQRELTKIIKDMEGLAKAEKELQDLQNIMEKNKVEREELSKQIEKSMSQKSFSELELPDDQVREEISRLRSEVEVLRSELQRAEVELQDKCWVPPPALQHWLQLTYELELKTYNKKKQSAERQLRQAKDACDKLKKKRSSLMGAFVSTHGKSIDDVDKAILEAKGSLTEITHELQERMHRWKQIEILANCPIMNNPGLHYLETVLRGYGKASSYGGPGSVISNSQDDIDDDASSSIYCPSAVSAPASTGTQHSMPRSKSVTSMLSLRERTMGREFLNRESSTADEDNMPGEASEMVSGRSERDRRVTFGIRPDRFTGEKNPMRESSGLERKQNIRNSLPSTPPPPSPNISEEIHEEESKSESFHTKEKPDLIKLSSYSPIKSCEVLNEENSSEPVNKVIEEPVMENSVQLLSPQSINTSLEKPTQSSCPSSTNHDLVRNHILEVNGVAKGSLMSRKVKFSEKVGVLRSLSRFVSQSSESLKSHKHYKVHVLENEKQNQRFLSSTTAENNGLEMSENGSYLTPVLSTQKTKPKLFSSFRKKKVRSADFQFQITKNTDEKLEQESEK